MLIPVDLDFGQAFAGSDHETWQAEYERNIHQETLVSRGLDLTTERGMHLIGAELAEPDVLGYEEQLLDVEDVVDLADRWQGGGEVWP